MIIISHRGYWLDISEKNKEIAFRRSFELGFGTETDVRDILGTLVISHDTPNGSEMSLDSFLALPGANSLTLALNIKADGLAKQVNEAIKKYQLKDWFVFDMSIPDMRSYIKLRHPVFSRMSEVERDPVWINDASGIWLDSFDSEWYDEALIATLLDSGKRVCIVSPELHGRNPILLWQKLSVLKASEQLILCTDYPERARDYFRSS